MMSVVALLVLTSANQQSAQLAGGAVTRLSHDDIKDTEVHFFRASDVKTPLAKYTVATPTECNASTSHARYSRVRLGPKSAVKRAQRAQCEATGTCVAANFLALKAGEEVLVFAVNHRTGHSGMTRVTVPTINRLQLGQDGGCAADNGGPSATYTEDGTTYCDGPA